MPAHVVFAPEWVIEDDGRGSFRVECDCGWQQDGFDTASSARAAGFVHSTGGRVDTDDGDGNATSTAPPGRRRWWRRPSRP